LKRHDTKPPFKVAVEDCEGPFDLDDENLVVEVNMWAKAKLKTAIDATIDYFAFADNIGFEQVMVGDIIIMDRVRRPEHMLVIAFDETNHLVQVQRGYNGSEPSCWKKGAPLRIFRVLNGVGEIEIVRGDVVQEDGTTLTDQLIESILVWEWTANSTCLPGCYWLEFKLIKMTEEPMTFMATSHLSSITPSFTSSTMSAADFGCTLGDGVDWIRRFPTCGEGFLVQITFSPTME
jgi:hypothetical protein